jgi:hypothetical protein
MHKEKLSRAVEMYFRAKTLIIKAEETDPQFKSFLQPKIEFASALDHLMRCHAAELGIKSEIEPEYEEKNLDKTLGHLYRALFDIADWLSINIREKIQNDLGVFSHEAIAAVFPEYYQTVKPDLDKADKQIVYLRNSKDIVNSGLIKEVDEYIHVIECLDQTMALVSSRLGSLNEYESKRNAHIKREHRFSLKTGIFLAVFSGIVGFLLALAFTR